MDTRTFVNGSSQEASNATAASSQVTQSSQPTSATIPLEKRNDFSQICRIGGALSLVSGMVNVVAFLELGTVVAHHTGNASHSGRLLGTGATRLVAIMSAYAAGAATAGYGNSDGDA